MINFGLTFVSFLGIALAAAGVGLYFLRSMRPELARDHDIFFAAISLVYGLILLFQGWRLDPILAFSQYLVAGTAVFFAVENLRLRRVTTEQAKRSTPIVDKGRPVSDKYEYEVQAELDEYPYIEDERYDRPRIRGSRDTRSSRNSTGAYEDEPRRRTGSRSSTVERTGYAERDREDRTERPRKRRPRPETPPTEPTTDEWREEERSEAKPSKSRTRPRRSQENQEPEETTVSPRSRRRQREEDSYRPSFDDDVEAKPADEYVDYQPVKSPDRQEDNSGNFDY
jgi:Ycf66 protein N-terminus